MQGDDGTARWVDAALDELAEGGIDRVRVEVVAERLGVTKGGFYRRFKDRRALLDALLASWSRGRIAAINQQFALDGVTPAERLGSLIKLYTERVSSHGIAIELAIRQWAHTDKAAAGAAALVDEHRLRNLEALYVKMGLTAKEAEGRAVLFYSFLFGQSLLFLDHVPRKRANLIAACADSLLQVETSSGETN
jgi:AcrR family transcriptional regulator